MHKLPAFDPIWAVYVAGFCMFGAWLHVMCRMFQVISRRARVQDLVRKHAPQMIEEINDSSFRRNADGKLVPLGFNGMLAKSERILDFFDGDELEDIPAIRDAKEAVRDAQELQRQAMATVIWVWPSSFLFVVVVCMLSIL